MQKVRDHNYYRWSVDKGDYKRDEDSTISYFKKRILIKRIKKSLWILLYLFGVIALSYFIFANY